MNVLVFYVRTKPHKAFKRARTKSAALSLTNKILVRDERLREIAEILL